MSYIKQQYTEPLDCAVGHIMNKCGANDVENLKIDNADQLDSIIKDFVDSMTKTAKNNIKTQKFKKTRKTILE